MNKIIGKILNIKNLNRARNTLLPFGLQKSKRFLFTYPRYQNYSFAKKISFFFSQKSSSFVQQTKQSLKAKRNIQAQQTSQNIYTIKNTQKILNNIMRLLFWTFISLFLYNVYNQLYAQQPQKNVFSFYPFKDSAKNCIQFFRSLFQPALKKLLPNNNIHPNIPVPKTLVLNLSGTLVHTEYVIGSGAKYIFRPGIAQFMQTMAQIYQIVIYTTDQTWFAMNVAQKLTPYNYFYGIFARQSLIYSFLNGKLIKDLSFLNRQLRKIIVIENDLSSLRQKQNAIVLPVFKGNKQDAELKNLVPFLKHLAQNNVVDVRSQLKKWGQNPHKKFKQELINRHNKLNQKKGIGILSFFFGKKKSSQ